MGSSWEEISIDGGFGLASVGNDSIFEAGALEIFKCPLDDSCLSNLSIAEVLVGHDRSCNTGYTNSSKVPFCSSCISGYSVQNNECSRCDAVQKSSIFVIGLLGVGLVLVVLGSLRLKFCSHHFQAVAALMRLIWPRITQSARLIITNYQILSGLPQRIRIPFPPGITGLLKSLTIMINFDVLTLPGLACVIGSNFYVKFLANMLVPLFIVLITLYVSKRHLKHLRTKAMALPKDLDVDLDTVGPKGSIERRRIVRRTINFKVCRAVVASKIQAPYYSFNCFIVYLRFPAVSRLVFDMFRCRSVAPDGSLLEADYQQKCFEGRHQIYYWIGWLFLCCYTLGIPLYIFYKLTSFKTTILGKPASQDYKPAVGKKGSDSYIPQIGQAAIPGNQNYIEIAPFKPLFQCESCTFHLNAVSPLTRTIAIPYSLQARVLPF